MMPVIEIRTYQLHQGSAACFDQTMQAQSLPLLRAAGTDVLAARPSLDDPTGYMLVRAYASLAARKASQDAFYGSDAWTAGPRATLMACIASYHSIVIAAEPQLIASMRSMGA